MEFKRFFDNDDDFFHVSCHVDPKLKEKIKRGEYVDLELLLPKGAGKKFGTYSEEKRIELVFTNESSYIAPAQDRENRISSIRKWEQAFRIYAAIYTDENPGRASEIWQYIYVINTAASSYSWDSVAYYDQTFRLMMSEKPWRSWAKTYTQGWNLALKGSGYGLNQPFSSGNNQNFSQNKQTVGNQSNNNSWKDDCCWRFQKNRCKRTAQECRYHHRCTHCAGWGHSYNNCRKRNRNGGRPNDRWVGPGASNSVTSSVASTNSPNNRKYGHNTSGGNTGFHQTSAPSSTNSNNNAGSNTSGAKVVHNK